MIFRFTRMGEKAEPLTSEEQCALSYELGKLVRVARIALSDSLYDASFAARNFGGVDRVLNNPIDFVEVVGANITNGK